MFELTFKEVFTDPVFIVFVLLLIGSIALDRLLRKSKHGCLGCLNTLIVVLLVFLIILNVVYWFFTGVEEEVSPTGEYTIIMTWIEQGGFGYTAHEIKVKENKLFGRKRGIGVFTPGGAEWVSDTEFSYADGGGRKGVLDVRTIFSDEWYNGGLHDAIEHSGTYG
ncbi:MAG: hypothetical protein LBN30_02655 [Oscillospiraceae bacterium]|jgi:hypothetical protein|nr:hypothetical protein [Oscillospiraceae bacterium]